ncbi:MAG: YvcK family protein [Candidatus Pacebacteria bacterium]|nr:YvcK family protein [Candidatus Paceibacterota bacterium]MCF7856923.1 YvcK family protein [Candidatus Paceibacterota bacterium]
MNTKKKKLVVIGGGTGTYTILSGLKHYKDIFDLTAIVAMTDSGGSTGRLRDEFGYLPVGDVRLALTALANEEDEQQELIRKLFLHRFDTEGDVSGHNFGNLFLVALTDILGSEELAIEAAARVLNICGKVIPVTHEKVHLVAEYEDGRVVVGEHDIDEPREHINSPIIKLSLTSPAQITKSAAQAIRSADVVVFGPGDLYTSILANCVVRGMQEALRDTQSELIYIPNLMTKKGQTTGKGVKEHINEISRYSGRTPDYVLINDVSFSHELQNRYAKYGEYPVKQNYDGENPKIITGDFLASEEIIPKKGDVLRRSFIRHDPHKLAAVLVSVFGDKKTSSFTSF